MSSDVVRRLESVAARLEQYATSLGGGVAAAGAVAVPSSSASVNATSSPKIRAFDDFYSSTVAPFVAAANKFDGTKKFGEWAERAFKHVRVVLLAESVSKKPSDSDFMKLLEPISNIIGNASNADNRSPWFNHEKAFGEAVSSLGWLAQPLPRPFVQDQLEAADFYLIKVLTESKKKSGQEATDYASFSSTLKAIIANQLPFITANFPTGLEWKANGSALSEFKADAGAVVSAGAPPPPGPPAAPMAPPPPSFSTPSAAPAKSSGGGMGAVFGEINSKGDGGVTSGLKKVTKDMKTKNITAPPLEAKTPAPKAAAAAKSAPVEAKPPSVHLNKGTWFVENYTSGVVNVPDVQLKESVYIVKCKNCTINIDAKCKSIQVDSCVKTEVSFRQVISIFEIFNSQRVTIHAVDQVPAVTLDKASGISINLSRSAVEAGAPQIISSNITEVNLVVPGKTDEDDPIEIPLPEQYITTYEQGKIKTECVAHSAN